MSSHAHEEFIEYKDVKLPSERSFGWTVGSVLLLFCITKRLIHGAWTVDTMATGCAGLALITVAVLAPQALAPLNRLWMQLGALLARITNPVIMFAIFGLIFTPYALVMRLSGRDALRLRRDANAASHWIDRDPPGPLPRSVEHQF